MYGYAVFGADFPPDGSAPESDFLCCTYRDSRYRFPAEALFPIIEQIANQGEGPLILADDTFVYSNIKNGHIHVTDSRLMYRRQ